MLTRRSPYSYQETAIIRGVKANTLIADDCGLGKTLTAVEIGLTMQYRDSRPVLVVCTKKVREQWVEEVAIQSGGYKAMILTSIEQIDTMLSSKNQCNCWYVIHYDLLVKAVKLSKPLSATMWLLVVADEAHKVKNRKAQRTLALKRLKAVRKIGLTATPMERSQADAWSLLNWLDSKQFSSYRRFYSEYVETDVNWLGYEVIIGNKNPEGFSRVIAPYVIRRTKEDVAPHLPPKIITVIPIALEPAQSRVYTKVAKAKDILVEVEDKELLVSSVLSKITRLQQIASNPALLGLSTPSAKLLWLDDFLEGCVEPVVIFTRYRETAIALHTKYESDLVIGGMAETEVPASRFKSGEVDKVIGTIDSMAEGLNLQRANIAIFLDCSWSTIQMHQAIDRIHRINITCPKQIIYLTAKGTVDELIMESLTRKWSSIDLVYEYLKELT